MPWQIWHKCHVSDPEPIPYAVLRSVFEEKPMTKVMCSKVGGCGEFFIIEGHEMFKEAQPDYRIPGFVFPSSRKD